MTAFADELAKTEYQSLRDESAQARAAQQQILQWSLAAFAAVFAAGLVLVAQDNVDVRRGMPGTVFLIVFGAALPGLVIAACLSWFGELIRMERAGRYLRAYEKEVAQRIQAATRGARPSPVRWETHIATGAAAGEGLGRGKQRVGYLGSLLLYPGALTISESLFLVAVHKHVWADETWDYLWVLLVVLASATWLGLLVLVIVMVRGLQRLGREAAPLEVVEPATQNYPL